MTAEALYDTDYYCRMRGGGELYVQFASILPLSDYRDQPILDVGCGRGDLIRHLIECGCRNLTGFDFSRDALTYAGAATNNISPSVSVTLKYGSIAERNLFSPESFALVFMTDVVEHLPSEILHEGLINVQYWLERYGRLVVHTFPTLGPHKLYRQILRLHGKTKELAVLDAIHCNVQTRKTLRAALEGAGFTVERMWLRNDVTLTSSAYKALRPGPFKTILGKLFEGALGSAWMRVLFQEYAAPSIYAVAKPAKTN